MTASIATLPRAEATRPNLTPRVAAYGFAGAWIAGLAVNPAGPAIDAPDAEVAAHYAGNAAGALTAEVLTHGVAAACLALVVAGIVRHARRTGSPHALYARAAYAGVAVSVVQLLTGTSAVIASEASTVADRFDLLNRLDGAKLLLFAVAAVASIRIIGGWLGRVSVVLAVTIAIAGVAFLVGSPTLALAAAPALVLLIVWVVASGRRAAGA